MKKKYDALIALAAPFIDSKGNLDSQTKERIEKSIELFSEGYSDKIIMSSGYLYNEEPNSTFASVMKLYAIEKGIPEKNIILEERSKETVGQAIFTKGLYLIQNGWKNIAIVPSDYHTYRSLQIFGFILGKNFNVDAFPSFTKNVVERRFLEKEINSLEAFYKTFDGIERGKDKEIHQRLINNHSVYKGRTDLLEDLILE